MILWTPKPKKPAKGAYERATNVAFELAKLRNGRANAAVFHDVMSMLIVDPVSDRVFVHPTELGLKLRDIIRPEYANCIWDAAEKLGYNPREVK